MSAPKPDRGWRGFLLWLVLIAVAVALGVGLWLSSRPGPVQLQGTAQARQVNVSTRVLARVEQIHAGVGTAVQAGQLLVELSSPELTGAQAQAGSIVSMTEAHTRIAEDAVRQEDVDSAHAIWLAAQAQADLAAVSAQRAEALYAEGVIAAQRRDEARALNQSAQRNAQAARSQWQKLEAGARQDARDAARAREEAARAALQTTQELDEETRLLAPIDGEVASQLAEVGEIVGPMAPILQLLDLADLHVAVSVREDQYQGMAMGRTLHGSVPALGRSDVAFRVSSIAPLGEFATWRATQQSSGFDVRSFQVQLKPESVVEGLRPGMSVLFPWPQ